MLDGTRKFSLVDRSNKEMKRTLTAVYDALKEKGATTRSTRSSVICFLRGPTYITNHNNARSLICKIDRDELMQELVQNSIWITDTIDMQQFFRCNDMSCQKNNRPSSKACGLFFFMVDIQRTKYCGTAAKEQNERISSYFKTGYDRARMVLLRLPDRDGDAYVDHPSFGTAIISPCTRGRRL